MYYIINFWLVVEKVEVTGENIDHVSYNQIKLALQNKIVGTLFTVNINDLQQELLKFPWVKKVVIERHFPDQLNIKIYEYTAFAIFSKGGLVSDDGKLFAGATNVNLPVIDSEVSDIPLAINYFKEINVFNKTHNLNLSKISINSFIVHFCYDNNFQLIICNNDKVEGKIFIVNKYYDKLLSLYPSIKYINTCYKNAFAIKI